MKQITILLLFILLCLAAGAVGSIFTAEAIPTWYQSIIKPAFNPPSWIFGPVWTILYVLMGVSLYLVWKNDWKVLNPVLVPSKKVWNRWSESFWVGAWQKQNVIAIFAIQYVLNILWSYVFFGLRMPGLAFFEILALWVSIIYLIINFYRISKPAAWILIPYIFWVSFAVYLNYSIWALNR